MISDYFRRLASETPTEFWINNPTPEQARQALEIGAVGATTNPTYPALLLRVDERRRYGRWSRSKRMRRRKIAANLFPDLV